MQTDVYMDLSMIQMNSAGRSSLCSQRGSQSQYINAIKMGVPRVDQSSFKIQIEVTQVKYELGYKKPFQGDWFFNASLCVTW